MKKYFFYLLLFLPLVAGCAGLNLQSTDVVFDAPSKMLAVFPSAPTDTEAEGIVLRFSPDPSGEAEFRSESVIYSDIKNDKGLRLKFTADRIETYRVGSRKDSFILDSETAWKGQSGKLREEFEQTRRGEILRFIGGSHRSKIGKFDITNWVRSPVFPDHAVTVGDAWSYEETMDVRMRSVWVREIDPHPYRIRVESVLEGFADVRGVRCAVIRSHTHQVKREHFKMLFKEMIFDIHTQMDDIHYFDYAGGITAGRVTRTRSYTEGINIGMNRDGQSQSVTVRTR
jgi:hypothetical protein